MDWAIIATIAQTALPVAIIVWLLWFITIKLWPWWLDERIFQREHKVRRATDEHAADMAQAEATMQSAAALAMLAKAIDGWFVLSKSET